MDDDTKTIEDLVVEKTQLSLDLANKDDEILNYKLTIKKLKSKLESMGVKVKV